MRGSFASIDITRRICTPLICRYSSGHAENNTPFVHHSFGGTLPLREKRSGY